MRTTCCLNLPTPSSNPTLHTRVPVKPPPHFPLVRDEACWRRRCILVKMASTLIGLDLASLVTAAEHQTALALPLPLPLPAAKWSHERTCPSWRQNSLETVVPENLPRPAARRRYESVRFFAFKTAPPLSAAVQIKADCFSL
ncbi:protein CHLOROPLAST VESICULATION [Prosopis cineraria]|uniref:protein CHLOROPLAST VESICULATION n=1 Tax=Prosopis cineraria TaxID=364024 RepID=UPI00240F77FB|nr:protein CHLOROPLAST VESICULATION [Prosopis cineraria]